MVRLELAYLYTRQGALIRAEQEYKKVLAYDPGNQQAFFYLAYIYLSRGQTEEALQYFRQLDRSGMLNEAMLEDYAVSMFVEGLDPGPVLERIDDGENLSATLRGILLLRKGDLQGARELFQSAAEEEPYMLAPYVGMIQIAQARGDKVVEAENRYALANSYYASGQYEQALEQTLKVRDAGPFLPEGSELQAENLYLLADIYAALGRADAAVREYEKYLANAENDGEVHFKLGLQYDSLGRYREAIQQFRLAAEQFPENHELYYYIGIEYRLLEDHEQAVDAFHQAVELDPDNAQYLFQLGVSYERMGDIASAVRYLEESVQLDDSDPSSLNYLGYLLADVGIRLDEAEEYIRKALEYEPRNGAYLDSMGWLYYRKSQFERAREYLEEAVRYMDDSETENYLILDHLGDVYLELDMPEKAIESWENALRMMQVGEIEQKIHEVRKELQ
jgi:tetratricopeptide (TPR) repeat protein